jgi:LmbE family N-acetylglucosaminyl deacetylase
VGDLLDAGSVTIDLATPSSALAIGAHPDDIEFGAGATLAKWAASGCRVHHLILTDGSKGSWDPDEDLDHLVAARQRECREAAARIDAGGIGGGVARDIRGDRVGFLGRVDGELTNGEAERREVARVIRSIRPDVILGHDPWRRYRLHPDHRAAGFLTVDAIVAARDPHFVRDLGLEPHRPSALLLWEPDLPNHVEGAAGFETAKVEALLCHGSQLETTMGLAPSDDGTGAVPGRDRFSAQIEWQLTQHGALAGLQVGEAFHLMDGL